MAQDARSAGIEDIQFFTDVDKKFEKKQEILTSTYPAWYFDQQLAAQKEELKQRKRRPADDEIVPSGPEYAAETRLLEAKVKEVEASRPKLNGPQKNFLTREVANLEAGIKETLFTYDDMQTGEASAHEELKRQMNPCVKIDKRLASMLNLKSYKGGMVSRDDATIATQICNKLLGENTNCEKLRPKSMTCRTRKVAPFTGDEDSPSFGEMMELQDGREPATPAVA
jgi:hypothetical protein